jgi:hypothetical protein
MQEPGGARCKRTTGGGMAGLVTASEWRVKRGCATLAEVRLKVRVSTAPRDAHERTVQSSVQQTNNRLQEGIT